MNTNKNSYIFIYATVMIVIVAVLLALASLLLKPYQEFNVEVEKKQNILSSIGIIADAKEAADLYKTHVISSYCVDSKGNKIEGSDAFNTNLKEEFSKPVEKQQYPIFECETIEKEKLFVLPILGKGLWGPIWGYVALKEDLNTIYGARFDHKGETPGLGAEIANAEFQEQFKLKQFFNEAGEFQSVQVLKPGNSKGNIHAVDGISGGTITSNGLGAMLKAGMGNYIPFITNKKKVE